MHAVIRRYDRVEGPFVWAADQFATHRVRPLAAAVPETPFVVAETKRLRGARAALDAELPTNPHVTVSDAGGGRIKRAPPAPQPAPARLERRKAELGRRWPMVGLLDLLKEADLRVGLTQAFVSATTPREALDRGVLQTRLLTAIRALSSRSGGRTLAQARLRGEAPRNQRSGADGAPFCGRRPRPANAVC